MFQGDLPAERLKALAGEARAWLAKAAHVEDRDWPAFTRAYEPGGDPAIHLFICRVCGAERFDVAYS